MRVSCRVLNDGMRLADYGIYSIKCIEVKKRARGLGGSRDITQSQYEIFVWVRPSVMQSDRFTFTTD